MGGPANPGRNCATDAPVSASSLPANRPVSSVRSTTRTPCRLPPMGGQCIGRYCRDVPGGEVTEDLRAFLHTLGVTDDQIALAAPDGNLAALAGDAILGEGLDLTVVDLAARTGTD